MMKLLPSKVFRFTFVFLNQSKKFELMKKIWSNDNVLSYHLLDREFPKMQLKKEIIYFEKLLSLV